MSNFKQKPFRSVKYRTWVKTQPCYSCGKEFEIDPHHLIGIGNMGGMGTKAPDSMVIPLCRTCHGIMHSNKNLWQYQWEWICRTLDKALSEGIIK